VRQRAEPKEPGFSPATTGVDKKHKEQGGGWHGQAVFAWPCSPATWPRNNGVAMPPINFSIQRHERKEVNQSHGVPVSGSPVHGPQSRKVAVISRKYVAYTPFLSGCVAEL
jgi:hypothetical protein